MRTDQGRHAGKWGEFQAKFIFSLKAVTAVCSRRIGIRRAGRVSSLFMLLTAFAICADVTYVYDDDGRLMQTADDNGSVVRYEYDLAGNVVAVIPSSSAPIVIFSVSPGRGAPGSTVTIAGGPFSPTANLNTVQFNGVGATVVSATVSTLSVVVPDGATTGKILVTTPVGSAQSANAFVVTGGVGPVGVTLENSQSATYDFTASGPTGYSLALANFTSTPTGGSVTATILNPNGSTLKGCGTYSATAGQCDFSVPTAGTYRVRLAPTSTATMNFSLVLSVNLLGTLVPGAPFVTFHAVLPGQDMVYSFPGVAGQAGTLLFRANTIPRGTVFVRKPDGSVLTNTGNYQNSSSWNIDFTTPVSGTYTATVYVDGTSTGQVEVKLLADAAGVVATDGTPLAVSLESGQNAVYSFTASGPAGYSVAMTGFASSPAGGSVAVTILDSNGVTLSNCRSYSATAGQCDFYVAAAGTYRVRLDPAGTAVTRFNLILSQDLVSALTQGAAPSTFIASVPGQNMVYSFSATAGRGGTLLLRNNTIPHGTIFIRKPDRSVLASTRDYNNKLDWTTDFIPPTTDTYTATVYVDGASTGQIDVQLLADEIGSAPTDGTPVALSLASGQNATYDFTVDGSSVYSLAISDFNSTPAGGSVAVTIKNSAGSVIKNCGVYTASSGHCDFLASAAGIYSVHLDPVGVTAVNFNLFVSKDLVGALTLDAEPMLFDATVPGRNIVYSFTGAAGQALRLQFTNNTIGYGTVYIRKPDGSVLTNTGNFSGKTNWNLDFTLPTSDTYTATVYVDRSSTGQINIQLLSR